MGRVCSGCLNEKPIVNDTQGFCEWCDKQRNRSITDILKGVDAICKDAKDYPIHIEDRMPTGLRKKIKEKKNDRV